MQSFNAGEFSISFFSWHRESMSSFGCKALRIIINFLVLEYLSSFLVHFKMVQSVLQGELPIYLFRRWDFYTFCCFFFPLFHYQHGTFFYSNFHSYISAVSLYKSFLSFKNFGKYLDITRIQDVVYLFLWLYKFLASNAFSYYMI